MLLDARLDVWLVEVLLDFRTALWLWKLADRFPKGPHFIAIPASLILFVGR